MTKLRIQAQHLQPGDIVGSNIIAKVIISSINWPSNKVYVEKLIKNGTELHSVLWGKYTMINVERNDAKTAT